MAKGARASTRKRNNRALRAKIFGPASDARTERLSTKLQELASRPGPNDETRMDVDGADTQIKSTKKNVLKSSESEETERMDLDAQGANQHLQKSTHGGHPRPSRIEKKIARRKARNSIVFAATPTQRKKRKLLIGSKKK